ncbi:RNA-directed DNA polymerase, eukaryota [Tanacetum coccineum]|uniref:RNA-directed DNA polymerase, eukaryota n=1 Tax=Tanacetum coccineum TaxID=301880 RepID=A0ABQ5I5N2_9ASTR
MSWYFILMKHVSQTFRTDERVIWIKIGSLPLNAWTIKEYKKIAGSWGEPLFVDEDPQKTLQLEEFEFAGWVPDFKDMESISCKNLETDNSDNHDHDVNDCGFHDLEEGEIPKTNESQEDEVVMNTQWSVDDEQNVKDHADSPINLENHKQPSKETSENQKEESESISKPHGFESFKNNNSQNSKQPSMASFAAAKTSRASKSHSKSINSHGSMIDAFIAHIEMGNVLGYDMEGSKNDLKKFIDNIGAKHGIQEKHSLNISPFKVKSLWGNFQFDYDLCPSSGRSGGLVSIWDPNVFTKHNAFPSKNFLIIEGTWKISHLHCFMINVYAPQDDKKKEMLWHNILEFMERNPGHYFIFGDFNVVRHASERIGTIFNATSSNVFNQFILDGHLWDIPLGGHLFTRVNNRGDKLNIVVEFWEKHDTESCPSPIVRFGKKMKALKSCIKEWSKNRSSSQSRDKEDLLKKIKEFDEINVKRTDDFMLDS